jgi:competence protein ComEC
LSCWLSLFAWLLLACPSQPGPLPPHTPRTPHTAGELAITFFDIGQGDSALIVSPTGKRVLIDGGPPEGVNALLAALAERHIDRIDLMLLSHPHMDHLAGLRRVAERLPVSVYMDGGYESRSPAYLGLLKVIAAKQIPVKQAKRGRTVDIGGGSTLSFLGPSEPFLDRTRSDVNANSVVARLTWGGRVVLFTGDAEPETERWLLAQEGIGPKAVAPPDPQLPLAAEVLKVGHHGGKYSSTAAFLAAIHPQLAVISCAAVNDYGHPTAEALGRLERVGARVLRTDRLGHITLRSRNGKPWQVENQPTSPSIPQPAPAGQRAPAPPTADPDKDVE